MWPVSPVVGVSYITQAPVHVTCTCRKMPTCTAVGAPQIIKTHPRSQVPW